MKKSKEKVINKQIENVKQTQDLEGAVLVDSEKYAQLVKEAAKGPKVVDNSVKNTKKRKIINGCLIGAAALGLGGGAAMLGISLSRNQPEPPAPVITKHKINWSTESSDYKLNLTNKSSGAQINPGDEVEANEEIEAKVTEIKVEHQTLDYLSINDVPYYFKQGETSIIFYMPYSDTNINLTFKSEELKVTFEKGDYPDIKWSGSLESIYNYGEQFGTKSAPTPILTNYTFQFWKDKNTGTEYKTDTPITNNVTLVPSFKKDVQYVTISFDPTQSGQGGGMVKIEKGTAWNKIAKPANPTALAEGKVFAHWTLDQSNPVPVPDNHVFNGDETVYAVYEVDLSVLTIKYNLGQGSSSGETTVKIDNEDPTKGVQFQDIPHPDVTPPLTPAGLQFRGWYYDPDLKKPVLNTDWFKENKELYAKYSVATKDDCFIHFVEPSDAPAGFEFYGNEDVLVSKSTSTYFWGVNAPQAYAPGSIFAGIWRAKEAFTWKDQNDNTHDVTAGEEIPDFTTTFVTSGDQTQPSHIHVYPELKASTLVTWDPNGGDLPWKEKNTTWIDSTQPVIDAIPNIIRENYKVSDWQYTFVPEPEESDWITIESEDFKFPVGTAKASVRPLWELAAKEVNIVDINGKTIEENTAIVTTKSLEVYSKVDPNPGVSQNVKWSITGWHGSPEFKPTLSSDILTDHVTIKAPEHTISDDSQYEGTFTLTATFSADSSEPKSKSITLRIVNPSVGNYGYYTYDKSDGRWYELSGLSYLSQQASIYQTPINGGNAVPIPRTEFDKPIYVGEKETTIAPYFLANCFNFNSNIIFPKNSQLLYISESFLDMATATGDNVPEFNQPLNIPSNVQIIGSDFLYNCKSFNQKIEFGSEEQKSNLRFIGDNFLSNCCYENEGEIISGFNTELVLPETLATIGTGFLSGDKAFNKSLTIPASVEDIGAEFLFMCDGLYSAPSAEDAPILNVLCSKYAFKSRSKTMFSTLTDIGTKTLKVSGFSKTAPDLKEEYPVFDPSEAYFRNIEYVDDSTEEIILNWDGSSFKSEAISQIKTNQIYEVKLTVPSDAEGWAACNMFEAKQDGTGKDFINTNAPISVYLDEIFSPSTNSSSSINGFFLEDAVPGQELIFRFTSSQILSNIVLQFTHTV